MKRATYLDRIQSDWQLNHFEVFWFISLAQTINLSKQHESGLNKVSKRHSLGLASAEIVLRLTGHWIEQIGIQSVGFESASLATGMLTSYRSTL